MKKPYWEGWTYVIQYNINGSFDATHESNKREAIKFAKEIAREHKGAMVSVYLTYIDPDWHEGHQQTVWRNPLFAQTYGSSR